ncbi:choice-of-anchor L domain-containing protein [Leifsonia xyli]|uniref:choice-of-anchor L domain-containing protein n=1 Tax=Leifsonia xyli TaxID=1575 RepID=UPI000412CBE4|nr:choice-of-anchor L domain-containing protein [Leifsonia xyli]
MRALGLEAGVALGTGRVKDGVLGPHGASKASTDLRQPGDDDLSALLGGHTRLFDAAVLEFDFVPRSSSLSIDYVFGSMEYPRFVGPKYTVNDVFGFFVNGKNCATVGGRVGLSRSKR